MWRAGCQKSRLDWMGGEFGGESTCICMAESLCGPPKTITTLLIGYTPIQSKKLKKRKVEWRILGWSLKN